MCDIDNRVAFGLIVNTRLNLGLVFIVIELGIVKL
jgi:hypothetical protein